MRNNFHDLLNVMAVNRNDMAVPVAIAPVISSKELKKALSGIAASEGGYVMLDIAGKDLDMDACAVTIPALLWHIPIIVQRGRMELRACIR